MLVFEEQAADAAGKRYVWTVNTGGGIGSALLSRLQAVVEGCVVPDPFRRWTLPHVLEALTTLQRDVTAAAFRVGSSSGSSRRILLPLPSVVVPPRPATPGPPTYDVVAIVAAMEALDLDTAAVIDTVGGKTASTLDALRTAGVPFAKCLAVKKAVTAGGGAHSSGRGPALVSRRWGFVAVWLRGCVAVWLCGCMSV